MIPPSTSVQSAPLGIEIEKYVYVCVCVLWCSHGAAAGLSDNTPLGVRLSVALMLGHQCSASNISTHWLCSSTQTHTHTHTHTHSQTRHQKCMLAVTQTQWLPFAHTHTHTHTHILLHPSWQSKALSDNLQQPAVCYITNGHPATIQRDKAAEIAPCR